jgi:hypothetical protein
MVSDRADSKEMTFILMDFDGLCNLYKIVQYDPQIIFRIWN